MLTDLFKAFLLSSGYSFWAFLVESSYGDLDYGGEAQVKLSLLTRYLPLCVGGLVRNPTLKAYDSIIGPNPLLEFWCVSSLVSSLLLLVIIRDL